MLKSLLQFALLALFGSALAQDLSVDTNWRKYSNSRPRAERITLAQNAINTMLPHLGSGGEFNGIGYWQSGNVWSAMALQDQLTGTTTNKATVVNNLKAVFKLRVNYDRFGQGDYLYNDDALWWAQAAMYAHKAYNDAELLNNAIATWNSVTRFAMTESQALTARHPLKNFALAGSCNGATMAGGVFWRPTVDDQAINSITTGLYVTLSAYLAETTGQAKYKDAAILSAKWIRAQNINGGNIVLDSVSGANCARSPATWIFTYNSGKFVEGLAVLFDVTKDNQWNQLMTNIIAAAVKNRSWQGANGIITEGSNNASNNDGIGFKAVFIRGLLEAFRRTPENTNLRILIHSYIDVQYNAVLDLARSGNSYSANWLGPASTTFTAWGQLAALDVLVAAVEAN
ncbi:endo-1,6-alpha-mannosidase [Crassisporium funariophilum]|nr:endo-1,6-alpha-mannosidase [Crassisporium funariophilum]